MSRLCVWCVSLRDRVAARRFDRAEFLSDADQKSLLRRLLPLCQQNFLHPPTASMRCPQSSRAMGRGAAQLAAGNNRQAKATASTGGCCCGADKGAERESEWAEGAKRWLCEQAAVCVLRRLVLAIGA